MCPRHRRIVAASLLVAVSSAAMAGVVRDQTGNPGVQTGGHALHAHVAPPVPHSLIGAIARDAAWPFGWPGLFAPFPSNPFNPFPPFERFAPIVPFHGFGRVGPPHDRHARHFDLPPD